MRRYLRSTNHGGQALSYSLRVSRKRRPLLLDRLAGLDMRLTGRLLKIEPYSGTMKGSDGLPFDYAGKRLLVLDDVQVIKVKIPKPLLETHGLDVGTDIDIQVTVEPKVGDRGAPYLATTLVGAVAPQLHSVSEAN